MIKVHRGLRVLKESKAFQGRRDPRVRKETKGRPDRKDNKAQREKRGYKEKQALQARRDPRERREKRARPDLKAFPVQPVQPRRPAFTSSGRTLAVTTAPCGSGETLASITCTNGTVSISKEGEAESVSCSNGSGPALALCVRQ